MSRSVRACAFVGLLFTVGCQNVPSTESTAGSPWSSWSSYAGSDDTSQYSSLAQINRSNVRDLRVAWTYPTGGLAHRSTPLVVDDRMFVVARGGLVALDAATGEELWFTPDAVAERVRGLSFWEDEATGARRVIAVKDQFLQAFDAATGERDTAFAGSGAIDLRRDLGRDPSSIDRVATMTPGRVFADTIIVGSAVGDETYEGAPGDIRAYDLRSGELAWSFHTIPHPGEFGYDTWPPEAWKTIGAANAWTAMSLDGERGIVYAVTGAPSYHFYGANRPGDNLFANSLLALDARTGERLWHFQAVHHDVWDYDIAMAPKLLTVRHEGRAVDAVVLSGKHGFMYVFDRVSGEPLFPIEERPVPQSDVPGEATSATQPYPVKPPGFARQTLSADGLSPYADPQETAELAERIRAARNEGLFTPPSFDGAVSAPGSRGGAQFGNGAVIPDAGLFYMAVIESPTIPKLVQKTEETAAHYAAASPAQVYASGCAVCHGDRGQGQPPLFPAIVGIGDRFDADEFAEIVKQGRGRMAGFQNMPAPLVTGLYQYVDGIAAAGEGELVGAGVASAATTGVMQRYRSGYHHFFSENGLVGPPPWSKLMAFDLNTGEVLWEKPYGDVLNLIERGITGTGSLFPTNSLMATAGGLLFTTTNDRKLRAWDQATGEILWRADLPADPGGIPATYQIAGRQYVVATATHNDRNPDHPGSFAYIAYALPVELDD